MKIINILIKVGFLILSLGQLYAQIGYDRIFVIDVSESMLKNRLHQKVQNEVINYIRNCKAGDRIIIIKFGDEVRFLEDRLLQEHTINSDLGSLINTIKRLNFTDDYTWMSKAFDIIGSYLNDLQKAYPDRPKRVYIFTDGLNDPPPDQRDLFTFEEVLRNRSLNYRKEGTYVYVILLGVKPDKEFRTFCDSIGVEIVTREREEPILYQEITFIPTSIEKAFKFSNRIQFDFEIEITNIKNINKEILYFRPFNIPSGIEVNLNPDSIICSQVGEKFTFNLTINNIQIPADYEIIFKPMPKNKNVVIDPQRFSLNIKISPAIIRIHPSNIPLKLDINKNKIKFNMRFENSAHDKEVLLKFSVLSVEHDKKLILEPQEILIPSGKSIKEFTLNYKGFNIGKFSYNLKVETSEPYIRIDPEKILLKITVYKPISLWIWIIPIFFLFSIFLGILGIVRINKAFEKWEIRILNSSVPLNKVKPFLSTSIKIGGEKGIIKTTSQEILEIFAKFDTIFNGNLYFRPKIELSEEFKSNIVYELKDISFNLEDEIINIRRRLI